MKVRPLLVRHLLHNRLLYSSGHDEHWCIPRLGNVSWLHISFGYSFTVWIMFINIQLYCCVYEGSTTRNSLNNSHINFTFCKTKLNYSFGAYKYCHASKQNLHTNELIWYTLDVLRFTACKASCSWCPEWRFQNLKNSNNTLIFFTVNLRSGLSFLAFFVISRTHSSLTVS